MKSEIKGTATSKRLGNTGLDVPKVTAAATLKSNGDKTSPLNSITKKYKGADKSLTRPGRKQATATEDFDVHISHS